MFFVGCMQSLVRGDVKFSVTRDHMHSKSWHELNYYYTTLAFLLLENEWNALVKPDRTKHQLQITLFRISVSPCFLYLGFKSVCLPFLLFSLASFVKIVFAYSEQVFKQKNVFFLPRMTPIENNNKHKECVRTHAIATRDLNPARKKLLFSYSFALLLLLLGCCFSKFICKPFFHSTNLFHTNYK